MPSVAVVFSTVPKTSSPGSFPTSDPIPVRPSHDPSPTCRTNHQATSNSAESYRRPKEGCMSNSLPTQAEIDAINQAYDAVEACYQQGLTNAIACGKLLKAAKKKVEHGEWLSWLKANC